MRTSIALIVSAAFVTLPPAASAQIQAPAASNAAKAAAPDGANGKLAPNTVEEKKICRQLPSSSSRLPNRVCLTRKEWQQVDEAQQ
jgi:hypothetical protein